jgi:tetratricopeptide (TPR) repeat protein
LANVLVTQKRFEEAEAHYVAALNLRPDYADGYVNRGFGLAQRGRTEEALTNYLFALQLKPEHFAAHKNLGALLAEHGRLDEAIAQFSEAARLAPDNPAAHYNLGTALLSQQRFAEAAAPLATSLQLNPSDLETRRNLALALMGQGKTAEAIPHLALVAAQRPAAQSHYELAEALLRQARSQEAAGHLRAALALKPDWMPALNNLAWILATHPDSKVRNGPEAVRLARRACELSSGTNGSLLATLAAAYAEAGQFEDAVNAARKVRELALAAGDRQAADAAQERITLYESRKPCRQQ